MSRTIAAAEFLNGLPDVVVRIKSGESKLDILLNAVMSTATLRVPESY